MSRSGKDRRGGHGPNRRQLRSCPCCTLPTRRDRQIEQLARQRPADLAEFELSETPRRAPMPVALQRRALNEPGAV